MKLTTRIALALAGGALLYAFLGNTWDYGRNCIRCCYYEHRIQRVFAGIPFYEFTMNTRSNYGKAYNEMFGEQCSHAMKKGGFGRNPGCGMTAEGSVFSGRNKAVKAIFEAYLRTTNRPLAQESFALVERLFPQDTTVAGYHEGDRARTNMTTIGEMVLYAEWLNRVERSEEWESVNESARSDFAWQPTFLSARRAAEGSAKSQLQQD